VNHAAVIRAALRHDTTLPTPCEGCLAEEALDALVAENRLLREDIRIREESQIPVIPRGAQEKMERLEAEIERLADRAVCSGCGQDVGESGICRTPECYDGEMIPASDLPGALLHACEERAEEQKEWRFDWEALRAEAKGLEAAMRAALNELDVPLSAEYCAPVESAVKILRAALEPTPASAFPGFTDGLNATLDAETGEPE